MHAILIVTAFLTFVFAMGIFRLVIPLATQWSLVGTPNQKKRNAYPTPIIGGVCVMLVWSLSVTFYSLVHPTWYAHHYKSLPAIAVSLLILLCLGLFDDLKGLSFWGKLFFQGLAAAVVLAYEPRTHQFCLLWLDTVGFFIWPLAMFWLVGLSNAINLIDGIDGLAGGIAFLVSCSLIALSSTWGYRGEFCFVLMTLFIAPILAFLVFNWHPAKIFLGDNGGLTIGFLIAVMSLSGPVQKESWIQILSILLMMGYPILDMGLCTLRHFKHKTPIFKADRAHLHYRLRRFGLSVPQICILLLSITFYLQLSSLSMNFMSIKIGFIFMVAISFSLLTLLYLLRSIERRRVQRFFHTTDDKDGPIVKECLVVKIDLEPLFEVGLFEEKERLNEVLNSLQLMFKAMVRKEDSIYVLKHSLNMLFINEDFNKESLKRLETQIKEKLGLFQVLYNLQCSLSDLSLKFEKQKFSLEKAA